MEPEIDDLVQEGQPEPQPGRTHCGKCLRPTTQCHIHRNQHWCTNCQKAYRRAWYAKQPKEVKDYYNRDREARQRAASRRWSKRRILDWAIKLEMIAAYGGCCSCCGEDEPKFLTLEHLDGGGNEHRRKMTRASKTWLDLKRREWPREGFTILCWNCQMGKTLYKTCPHKDSKQAVA